MLSKQRAARQALARAGKPVAPIGAPVRVIEVDAAAAMKARLDEERSESYVRDYLADRIDYVSDADLCREAGVRPYGEL